MFYWITAAAVLLFTLWVLSVCWRAGYRAFRQGVISLEAVVLFIGAALTLAYIVWILPTGWIPPLPNKSLEQTPVHALNSAFPIDIMATATLWR